MLSTFLLLALAVCLSPAAGNVKQCTKYKPFDEKWICKDNQQYNHAQINNELSSFTTRSADRSLWAGDTYIDSTVNCVEDIPKPPPVVARVKTRHRLIRFEELCAMEKIPVFNVFENLSNGHQSRTYECIVVNTDWMQQDMYFAKCVNPSSAGRNGDKCQMDYGTREEFRCVQSGFVQKRILVYCPQADEYVFTIRKVPTTCSCRKCFHCESEKSLFADLLSGLDNRFTLSPITPIKVKPMGCHA